MLRLSTSFIYSKNVKENIEYSIFSKMKISRLLNYSTDMCQSCQGTMISAWNYNAIMHSIFVDKHKVFTHLT